MQKEVILIMDFRYDEGARPRKEMISPCICTNGGGKDGLSGTPMILERWTQSESNKPQKRDI